MRTVKKEGLEDRHFLGIYRSDYMLHCKDPHSQPTALYQVELNTIAASFSNLSVFTANLHRWKCYTID